MDEPEHEAQYTTSLDLLKSTALDAFIEKLEQLKPAPGTTEFAWQNEDLCARYHTHVLDLVRQEARPALQGDTPGFSGNALKRTLNEAAADIIAELAGSYFAEDTLDALDENLKKIDAALEENPYFVFLRSKKLFPSKTVDPRYFAQKETLDEEFELFADSGGLDAAAAIGAFEKWCKKEALIDHSAQIARLFLRCAVDAAKPRVVPEFDSEEVIHGLRSLADQENFLQTLEMQDVHSGMDFEAQMWAADSLFMDHLKEQVQQWDRPLLTTTRFSEMLETSRMAAVLMLLKEDVPTSDVALKEWSNTVYHSAYCSFLREPRNNIIHADNSIDYQRYCAMKDALDTEFLASPAAKDIDAMEDIEAFEKMSLYVQICDSSRQVGNRFNHYCENAQSIRPAQSYLMTPGIRRLVHQLKQDTHFTDASADMPVTFADSCMQDNSQYLKNVVARLEAHMQTPAPLRSEAFQNILEKETEERVRSIMQLSPDAGVSFHKDMLTRQIMQSGFFYYLMNDPHCSANNEFNPVYYQDHKTELKDRFNKEYPDFACFMILDAQALDQWVRILKVETIERELQPAFSKLVGQLTQARHEGRC